MNSPLILVVLYLVKTLKCAEQETMQTNDTKLEKEVNSNVEEDSYAQEITTIVNFNQPKCQCPCKDVPRAPVCSKTTNGQLKTFDSQCHLICHNQCGSAERYAIIFHHECPMLPTTNRKWQCDCSVCQETKWIRFDYYPICAERGGQKVTFESWCHFDCENKCLKHTGYIYMYLYRGPCEQDMQQEYTEEIIIPRDHRISHTQPCDACSTRCKDFFEPVCVKNDKNDHLSFKSRCHMRCHIQCSHEKSDSYTEVYEGHCPWI